MGQKAVKYYCPECGQEYFETVKTVNHLLHFILTICTGGMWLIIWAFLFFKSLGAPKSKHRTCFVPGVRVAS